MVVRAFDPNTLEAEADGRLWVQGHPSFQSSPRSAKALYKDLVSKTNKQQQNKQKPRQEKKKTGLFIPEANSQQALLHPAGCGNDTLGTPHAVRHCSDWALSVYQRWLQDSSSQRLAKCTFSNAMVSLGLRQTINGWELFLVKVWLWEELWGH